MMCLEAVGQIVELPPETPGIAIVQVEGRARRVSLVMLELENNVVNPGDWILSHTGLAVRVVAEEEAIELQERRSEMRDALSQSSVFEEHPLTEERATLTGTDTEGDE